MDEFFIRLFAEAPLAAALAYAARLLAPVLAEHLKQQRGILDRLTQAVETMGGRLDKVEAKLDRVVDQVEQTLDAVGEGDHAAT